MNTFTTANNARGVRRLLRHLLAPIALGFVLVTASISAQGLTFYRFKNAQGITMISTKIPAEFISKGYDIVSSDGRLIERIAAEPSAEEKQRILDAQAEAERFKKRDRALLSRYSSVSDIESERTRKLNQLDTDIELRKRSIEKTDEETALWQSKAADEERRGQKVSQATLNKLASLRDQKTSVLTAIAQKEKERQTAIEKFEEDIERFRVIRP